ncbi:ribonuclease P protein component [bacterium]|nr:ribonuclease P protein component [bacterium]
MKTLKKKQDFQRVFDEGRFITKRNSPIKIYALKEGTDLMLGIMIRRTVINAVGRNYTKRQIKAIFLDLEREGFSGKYILMPTKGFVKSEYKEKEDRLRRILQNFHNQQNRDMDHRKNI